MAQERPPDFPDLGEHLSPGDLEKNLGELWRRLKSETNGDCLEGNSLARTLSQDRLMLNESNKIRLLTSCCIADVFRLRAPECPYKDKNKLKNILEFLVEQFEYLQNDDRFFLEKSSYLVASLAKAKTLNLHLDLESSTHFVVKVFTHFMAVISFRSSHNLKEISEVVRRFMVDILASLINEPDSVSDDLIDSMKEFLLRKDDSETTSRLCREVIAKASDSLEGHIDRFFGTEFGHGRVQMMCELFLELYSIIPQNLICFVLKLDTMLQSKNDAVRIEATEFVARLMASTDLISSFPSLHKDFLARYNDQKYEIRMKCIEMSFPLLLQQSLLRDEIVEAVKSRQHDVNESVRFQVVFTILKAAESDITTVYDVGLLDIVRERTLDTNFKVRRLALIGIGQLYRKFTSRPLPAGVNGSEESQGWQGDSEAARKVDWIRNKVLHRYYQTSLQDRLIVERILYTCLVPFWLSSEERTEKLYQLFTTSDEHAARALIQILKFQHTYRQQLKGMMHLVDESETTVENRGKLDTLVEFMAQQVSDEESAKNHIIEFLQLVRNSPTLHRHTTQVLEAKTFEEVNENVRSIMRTLGNPHNALFVIVKQLLERVAPLIVDSTGISHILQVAREKLECVQEEEGRRCLELLVVLAEVHPETFMEREIVEELCDLLAAKWDAETALLLVEILYNLRKKSIEEFFPDCAVALKSTLRKFLEKGTPKRAKLAVRCINSLFEDAASCFSDILRRLTDVVNKAICQPKSTPHLETVLVSLGQIAGLRPECFNPHREYITVEIAVKRILVPPSNPPETPQSDFRATRQSKSRGARSSSYDAKNQEKLAAMKLTAHALVGLANLYCARAPKADESRKKMMLEFMNWDAECTLRLLFTAVERDGDLLNSGKLSEVEKAQFRLKAATSILKICRFKNFADIATGAQFRSLAKLVIDSSRSVRERFCEKLHRRLLALRLPLQFMALFSYGALEPDEELQERIRGYLVANIKKRREHLKQHSIDGATRMTILPDNVIGYVIHMLAHDPSFKTTKDVQTLEKIRECLWFQLQFHCCDSNENYSFPFFRKLVETIKRSRDREGPHDVEMNTRLYAVCDIALGLIMSRTTNFGRFPSSEKVHLPLKLFIQPSQDTAFNSTYYLPAELTFTPLAARKGTPSAKTKRPPERVATTPSRRRKVSRKKLSNIGSGEEGEEDDDDLDEDD